LFQYPEPAGYSQPRLAPSPIHFIFRKSTLPVVTLSLPIYNAERFLAEAVESIKAQTLTDFEVIAVLDGCTDRSEEILRDLVDERFIVEKKERNEGVVAASNFGLFHARGEFFGRTDADDVLDPHKLQKQVAFLNDHPDVDIVGAWFDYIDERGKRIRKAYPFATTHEDLLCSFRRMNSIGGPVALGRSERLRIIGGYSDQLPYAEDLTLWLKCLAGGYRFANLPEVLYHYRLTREQLSDRRNAETNRMTNLAYKQYGPLIWGDDAPDVEFGASIPKRALRKIKRLLGLIK